ncbi:MAG: methylated-DNA--[protein]-cysteine S-methyltransferase [Desulfomonilaceae bacterium]
MGSEVSMRHYYNKVVGWLKIVTTDVGIIEVSFTKSPEECVESASHPFLESLFTELDNYFRGTSCVFTTPIHFNKGTEFQQRVWKELLKIPAGDTKSYGQIAATIGNPKAARAVGNANGKNPIPIVVPCHRVVNSDGSLGGYSSGTNIKKALLDLEKIFWGGLPLEREAKLVIVSNNPASIILNLKTLNFIAGFPLGPWNEQCFQDLYFDLPDRSLSQRKWALRLRKCGNMDRIAIKGPAIEMSDGSISRPEIEMESNREAVKRIMAHMKGLGINIVSTLSKQYINVQDSLKFLRLEVIQKRDTRRVVRKIFDPGTSEPIAELDIDQVSFIAGDKELEHYEIEIESWATPNCPVIENSLEFLKSKFGDSVATWKLDKLSTVKLICDLFQEGRAPRDFSGKLLTVPIYEMVIEQSVRRERCAGASF